MKRYIRSAEELKTYIVFYVDDTDQSREIRIRAESPEAAKRAAKKKLGKSCWRAHTAVAVPDNIGKNASSGTPLEGQF